MSRLPTSSLSLLLPLALFALGCPPDAGTGGTADGGATTADAGTTTDGGTSTDGGTTTDAGTQPAPCVQTSCSGKVWACGDCLDNDGDGLTDLEDSNCLGPCDNSETSFFLDIPGAGPNSCQLDCYFDSDSGAGNDSCAWSHYCDPLEPQAEQGCNFSDPPPAKASCPPTQDPVCAEVCQPLVPNGCDCFGCCELPAGGGNFVFIGSRNVAGEFTCDADGVSDPNRCHPCTPVPNCQKECGRCQLCLGKTEVPADCLDGGGTPADQCPGGEQPCGLAGQDACPTGQFCLTGCCAVNPG